MRKHVGLSAAFAGAIALLLVLGASRAGGSGATQPDASASPPTRIETAATLKAALEAVGFTPTEAAPGVWNIKHVVATTSGQDWTVDFTVTLQADLTVIWVNCYIGLLSDPETVATKHFLAMLEQQGRMTGHFYVLRNETGTHLYLARGIDNRAVTPGLLKAELDALHTVMGTCVDVWNINTWTRSGS